MKTLKEYILEQKNIVEQYAPKKPADSSKSFHLNMSGVDGAKEIIEEVTKLAEEKGFECSSTEDSFDIIIKREQCDNGSVNEIKTKLQDFIKQARKDSKNASNETYAQKTHALMDQIEEMVEYIEWVEDDDENNPQNTEKGKDINDEQQGENLNK